MWTLLKSTINVWWVLFAAAWWNWFLLLASGCVLAMQCSPHTPPRSRFVCLLPSLVRMSNHWHTMIFSRSETDDFVLNMVFFPLHSIKRRPRRDPFISLLLSRLLCVLYIFFNARSYRDMNNVQNNFSIICQHRSTEMFSAMKTITRSKFLPHTRYVSIICTKTFSLLAILSALVHNIDMWL